MTSIIHKKVIEVIIEKLNIKEYGGGAITIIIERFPNTDWWCDRCNAYLNNQSGFNDHKYIWKCTECGYKNSISSSNICESKDDYKNPKKR